MQKSNEANVAEKRSLVAILGSTVHATWSSAQLPTPEIDADLTEMSAVERIAEVLRYKLLQLEFSISRGGGIRAWLRLNLFLTAVLAIPALFVVPVVTWLMGSFVTLSELLLAVAQNLLSTLITIITFVILLLVFAYGLKLGWRAYTKQQRSRKRRDH